MTALCARQLRSKGHVSCEESGRDTGGGHFGALYAAWSAQCSRARPRVGAADAALYGSAACVPSLPSTGGVMSTEITPSLGEQEYGDTAMKLSSSASRADTLHDSNSAAILHEDRRGTPTMVLPTSPWAEEVPVSILLVEDTGEGFPAFCSVTEVDGEVQTPQSELSHDGLLHSQSVKPTQLSRGVQGQVLPKHSTIVRNVHHSASGLPAAAFTTAFVMKQATGDGDAVCLDNVDQYFNNCKRPRSGRIVPASLMTISSMSTAPQTQKRGRDDGCYIAKIGSKGKEKIESTRAWCSYDDFLSESECSEQLSTPTVVGTCTESEEGAQVIEVAPDSISGPIKGGIRKIKKKTTMRYKAAFVSEAASPRLILEGKREASTAYLMEWHPHIDLVTHDPRQRSFWPSWLHPVFHQESDELTPRVSLPMLEK